MTKQNLKIGLGFIMANMCIAFYYTYLPQLFASYGFNSQQIGTLLMIYVLVAVVAMPLMGILTDKLVPDKILLIALLTISCICSFVYFKAEKTYLNSAIFMAMLSFAFKPVVSIIDPYTYKLINDGDQIDYGIVRAMGSLGFAIGAYAVGKAIDVSGYNVLYYAQMLGVTVTGIVILVFFRKIEKKEPQEPKELTYTVTVKATDKAKEEEENKENVFLRLLKNRDYMALIIGGFFINIAVSMHFTYMPLVLQENGATSTQIGLAFSLMALAEVPIIGTINKIRTKIAPATLIIIAGTVYIIRMMVVVNFPSVGIFMFMGIFQSVSLGFISPMYIFIMNRIVPRDITSTAVLTGITIIYNLSAVFSMYYGGYFMDLYGYAIVLNVGWVLCLVGTLIFLFNFRLIKNKNRRAML